MTTEREQKAKDFAQYRGRIRRKIMHRITRTLNKRVIQQVPSNYDDAEVYDRCFKDVVQRAITEVLEEEIRDARSR